MAVQIIRENRSLWRSNSPLEMVWKQNDVRCFSRAASLFSKVSGFGAFCGRRTIQLNCMYQCMIYALPAM